MSAAKHFFERGRVEVNQMSADGPGYRGERYGRRRGAVQRVFTTASAD